MVTIDYYAGVGFSLELLAQSKYHKRFTTASYLHTEIIPPLKFNQARFYLDPNGVPTGLVTWAWLSKSIEHEVHTTGRALAFDEWQSGDRLFINDWITPYNNIREVVNDMSLNVFPDKTATSLRRKPDGSVHRICRWAGANTQRETSEAIS